MERPHKGVAVHLRDKQHVHICAVDDGECASAAAKVDDSCGPCRRRAKAAGGGRAGLGLPDQSVARRPTVAPRLDANIGLVDCHVQQWGLGRAVECPDSPRPLPPLAALVRCCAGVAFHGDDSCPPHNREALFWNSVRFFAQILAQFQLSQHYVLFYFETGSIVGFVVLKLTLEFSAASQKTSGPHNTTTTTSPRLPKSHKLRPPLFSKHLHHAASSEALPLDDDQPWYQLYAVGRLYLHQ